VVVNKGRKGFAPKISKEGAKVFIKAHPSCKKSGWIMLNEDMDRLALQIQVSLWKVWKGVELFTPKYH
jgi:hypothetical protein